MRQSATIPQKKKNEEELERERKEDGGINSIVAIMLGQREFHEQIDRG